MPLDISGVYFGVKGFFQETVVPGNNLNLTKKPFYGLIQGVLLGRFPVALLCGHGYLCLSKSILLELRTPPLEVSPNPGEICPSRAFLMSPLITPAHR